MQVRFFLHLICFLCYLVINIDTFAQGEQGDTLRLGEVTVRAQQQYVTGEAVVYVPTKADKKDAQSAVDLLRMSAIPQIKVNPVDDKVTDNFGEDVSIFLNYLPAGKEDIAGLKTSDVRKIEYLTSPTDPRFRGAKSVINIIVTEYAYGGYTKLSSTLRTICEISGGVDVYSKFAYKRMTFDLYAALKESSTHHSGTSNDDRYSLADGIVTRKETPQSSYLRDSRYPITFRATYNAPTMQLSNAVAFSHTATRANDESGLIDYNGGAYGATSEAYRRYEPDMSNSAMFLGSYYFELPKGWALNIVPQLSYSHYTDNLGYYVTDSSPIIRDIAEDATSGAIDGYLEKTFGQSHSLILGVSYENEHNTLHYIRENSKETITYDAIDGYAGYTFSKNGLTASIEGGMKWDKSKAGYSSDHSISPFVDCDLRYSPDTRNMFSASIRYKTTPPYSFQKTSAILQENEYLYVTGNASLKNDRQLTANLGYSYIPSNLITLSGYASYRGIYDRITESYAPYAEGTRLLRTYANDGRYDRIMAGVSLSWKPLDGKLVVSSSPGFAHYQISGPVARCYNAFQFNASVRGSLSNFYASASFKLQSRELAGSNNAIWKDRDYYSIEAGWANDNLNVRLNAANLFNRGWVSITQDMESELYSYYRTYYGSTYHPTLSLSVTYTIGYGKKITRRNEIGELNQSSSAIMK